MKKIFIFAIAMLCIAGMAYAEIGATAYTGKRFEEQQQFIIGYNNSGSSISSNYVVVVDTTAANIASGSTLGAYINTTTTAADARVIGVTDETIANGHYGKVCVRGPHKVYLTAAPSAAGATIASTTTAGAAIPWTSTRPGSQAFGFALSATVIGDGWYTTDGGGFSPVADGMTQGDGTSNYWCYIGGASK